MRVVHIKTGEHTTYIGRPSVLGNPFVIGKHGDRAEVIRRFEQYARNSLAVQLAIRELPDDAVLGCYCAPQACHGDVIAKLHEELKSSTR